MRPARILLNVCHFTLHPSTLTHRQRAHARTHKHTHTRTRTRTRTRARAHTHTHTMSTWSRHTDAGGGEDSQRAPLQPPMSLAPAYPPHAPPQRPAHEPPPPPRTSSQHPAGQSPPQPRSAEPHCLAQAGAASAAQTRRAEGYQEVKPPCLHSAYHLLSPLPAHRHPVRRIPRGIRRLSVREGEEQ